MRILRHLQDLPDDLSGSSVAIGNFDGVHLGHRVVIDEAGRSAKTHGVPWAVMTFEPHPRLFFKPDQPPFRLTPFRDKAAAIEALGVDLMVVLRFDSEFSSLSANDFIQKTLVDGLKARAVTAGYDFVFGKGRGGDCSTLLTQGQAHGFDFTAVHPQEDAGGDVYSSTRVRDYLVKGDIGAAAEILGRPFTISGRVRGGDQRGRTIGFPTANLHLGNRLRPALGVYAVRVTLEGEADALPAVANLGRRPTFGKEDEILEIHLLDFDADLYGRRLEVTFTDFLRPEQRFDGIDALKEQIARDSEQARIVLDG